MRETKLKAYFPMLNVENVMGLFSEELARIDKNTTRYMMHEMQEEIDQQKAEIEQQKAEIEQQKAENEQQRVEIQKLRDALALANIKI